MRKTSESQPLLLDTHVWLWLVLGNESLSPPVRSTISGAASIGNLRVAAITVWEIAVLASRHRVALGKPTVQWVEEAVAASTVIIEPLSPDTAVESWELPDGSCRPGRPHDRRRGEGDECQVDDPRPANPRLRRSRAFDGASRLRAVFLSPDDHRGSRLVPIRNSSTARAHWRPSRIAQTIKDWPRRMSPAANNLATEVR
jgi:PIN domain nuclease of toxin-antitoxin system